MRRQRFAVRLIDVEHVRRAESTDGSRVVAFGLGLTSADDRRHDRDALLALANEATHRAPRLKPRDACRGRTLTRDETDVVPGVLVESRHRLEQRGELVATAFVEQCRE